jgi:hypothetical protein
MMMVGIISLWMMRMMEDGEKNKCRCALQQMTTTSATYVE